MVEVGIVGGSGFIGCAREGRRGYEVNVLGTQNICEVVEHNPLIKEMILTGSWHVVGERELRGVIDEEFGFRPDKVEDRARFYALQKSSRDHC